MEDQYKCPNCGRTLGVQVSKFCNQSCAATYNNKRRISKKAQATCKKCGISLRGKVGKEFCSYECLGNHRVITTFQSGSPGPRNLRSYLHLTRVNKCAICGIQSWCEKPLTLEVDHIDGDATNNIDTNLRLLCPNCHSQTPTYKAKNKGYGRKKRAT